MSVTSFFIMSVSLVWTVQGDSANCLLDPRLVIWSTILTSIELLK